MVVRSTTLVRFFTFRFGTQMFLLWFLHVPLWTIKKLSTYPTGYCYTLHTREHRVAKNHRSMDEPYMRSIVGVTLPKFSPPRCLAGKSPIHIRKLVPAPNRKRFIGPRPLLVFIDLSLGNPPTCVLALKSMHN